MPVYSSRKEGILVITVDGDYTAGELKRVGGAAVAEPEASRPLRVLLDVSGAAGLTKRTPAELTEVAEIFADMGDALHALAVLAPGDAEYSLMRVGMGMSKSDMRWEVFQDRAGATEWLTTK